MAVDTPVLERRKEQLNKGGNTPFTVPTRSEYEAEDEHNARIKDNYARLINPNNRIEDIFNQSCVENVQARPVQNVQRVQNVQPAQPVQNVQPVQAEPYLVQNARADAAIFRADNPINQRFIAANPVVDTMSEEDNEDLRPTAATIQYRTVDSEESEPITSQSENYTMSKKQKTALIVLVAVIVSLIALIIINSTVIANLNSDIAQLNYDIASINTEIEYSVSQISGKINQARLSINS